VALAALPLAAGCSNDVANALQPQGPAAGSIANLWWVLFGMGAVVYVLVLAYMGYALMHRRGQAREGGAVAADERHGQRMIIWAGIVVPLIILGVVFGATVMTLRALSMGDNANANTVRVTGRQWWWEVHYPAHGFETANEIHIPVGERVQIVLDSVDVIHSFWVPSLHGKLDMTPGSTTRFWIQADAPGTYRGICAEFCGVQHANMAFAVVAQPAEEYQAWVEAQTQPAAAAVSEEQIRGAELFLNQGCLECHAIRGTDATGDLGPDLTHLASRPWLAAMTVENNRGNLGGWIADPQHIKPGALMPATPLTGADLNALIAYLEGLD
jgi:cytochrome c oxidase subunit 2